MAETAVRLLISGRVQGVGFRAWTRHQARRRGLRGWVRNLRDGRVEAQIAGEAAAVEGLIEACRRGPAMADVTGIERAPAQDDGATGFAERPTI